jgi:hypothetical protein
MPRAMEILEGYLEVDESLPGDLAQGMLAKPRALSGCTGAKGDELAPPHVSQAEDTLPHRCRDDALCITAKFGVNVRVGSFARITAPQHFCPLHPS